MPESLPRRNAGSHTVAQDLALRPSHARLAEPTAGIVRYPSPLYLGLMKNIAAGLLMYRLNSGTPEYFLVHPGGPFFKNKDNGVWSIPKGLPENEETLLETARREFLEETGISPQPPFFELGSVKQKGGKVVHAWAFEGAWEPSMGITCNTFIMEWPPRSGKKTEFPEMDKAEWYTYESALEKIIPEQVPLLDRSRIFITT